MRFCLLTSLWNVLKYCVNVGHYGDWAVNLNICDFGGQQWQGLVISPPHVDSS